MKILNIHGYKGSAENSAYMTLKKLGHEVISPQIDYDAKTPFQIRRDLKNIFNENKPDYITGTSLGGFFSLLLSQEFKVKRNIPIVLVNPCLRPSVTLSELGYKIDKIRETALLKAESMIEKIDCRNVVAVIGGQDEVISYHDYTKKIIKNNYVVPDGKHSGATLNLDYWFKRLIK